MQNVLILHNTFGDTDNLLYESRAGVMDQVRAVGQSLDTLQIGYEVHAVEDLRHLTQILKSHRYAIIFNLVEEFLGSIEQACYVPAVCRAFETSCTGNDTSALLLAQNKIHAKAVLIGAGLSCPDGIAVTCGQRVDWRNLTAGQYIFKPAFCDASEGISHNSVLSIPAEFHKADIMIESLHRQFSQPVIVEQFIPARELNISVIEHAGSIQVLPAAEIDFGAFADSQVKIVDYNAKWQKESFSYKNTPRKIPADLPEDVANRVISLAAAAFEAIGCRDYARVDFRLDEDLNPFILEVNPNPDISLDAGFVAALQAAGISYEEFVKTVLNNAYHRLHASTEKLVVNQ